MACIAAYSLLDVWHEDGAWRLEHASDVTVGSVLFDPVRPSVRPRVVDRWQQYVPCDLYQYKALRCACFQTVLYGDEWTTAAEVPSAMGPFYQTNVDVVTLVVDDGYSISADGVACAVFVRRG